MKRYLLLPLLLLSLTCTYGCASSKDNTTVDDLFNEFSKVKNAEYVSLNPFMMSMANLVTNMTSQDAAKITSKIKSVKVITLDNPSDETKRQLGERISTLDTDGYEELMRVTDNDEKVRILAHMDKNSTIRRLIVLCTDSNECSLISIKGKFDPKDINSVVNNATNKHDGSK